MRFGGWVGCLPLPSAPPAEVVTRAEAVQAAAKDRVRQVRPFAQRGRSH
jgi:hypothetical protein